MSAPIGDLLDALVQIRYKSNTPARNAGYPPVRFSPAHIADGDPVAVDQGQCVEPIIHRRIDGRTATESQRHPFTSSAS